MWDRAGASSRGSRLCQPRVSVDVLPLLSARRAGLLRSQGHCENPHCTGEPQDIINTCHPILEVDHIHDLAKGSLDHTEQMIALCPDCHAVKTRGRTREQLRHGLLTRVSSGTRQSCHDRKVPRLRASSPVPLDGGYPPGRFLIRLSVNALRRLAAR